MDNFIFHSPTEFVFGKGVESQAGALSKKYGATKVMLVYGQGSVVRSGLLDKIKSSLNDSEIKFVEFSGVQPNPLDDKVYEGIERAKNEKVDMMLAVGGGSVIDTAKAIALGTVDEGDFWDFYVNKRQAVKALKVAVVLTIPAAGSEGSGNAVITNHKTHQKLSLRYPNILRPVFSLMNPELTYTLPPFQMACGVSDIMAHILERYFTNTPDNEVTDRLCESLLLSIVKQAPLVMANPTDYQARANIMWAGTIAHNGICGVGREEDWTSHFIEHEISALYNVAHGAGLAVVFPAFLTFVADKNVGKVAQLAERVWGVPHYADAKAMALEGVNRYKSFLHSMGLPLTLKELGIENADIELLVRNLHANKGALIGNYVKLFEEDTTAILNLCRK